MGTTTNVATDALVLKNSPATVEDPAVTGVIAPMQGITQFLQKPILITNFNFGVTNLRDDQLTYFDILPALRDNPIWFDKIKGAAHVRGTAIVTLQANPAPYNAGGLIMSFIPNYADNPTFHTGRNFLTARTQLPHIKMDISTTKEITMEIPYTAPTKYCNITNSEYDWGRVFVNVMSPFRTGAGTPTSIPISMWLSFENFETEVAIVPQGGVRKGQRGRVSAYDKTPSEQELGPVSRVLGAVSTIAKTLSGVPLLAPLTGPVAWFTNVAAGVATSFGWSKPLLDDAGNRMVQVTHYGAPNCNGKDLSQSLALFADSKVRVMSGLGREDVDEMSINFLKTIPAYQSFITLDVNDSAGQLLYSQPVAPGFFSSLATLTNDTATEQVLRCSPISFLARMFKLWRGSLNCRMHIYKTQFHSGRIIVSFVPGPPAAPPSVQQTSYLHRAIIDLNEGNEACFSFPYTNTKDYIDTASPSGTVYIHVLNPLRAPESVATTVDMTFEWFGGDDLEFQMPRIKYTQPIVAQMGGENGEATNAPDNLVCESIGHSTLQSEVQGASQYCIGEHVTSLLQLLKRYTAFYIFTDDTPVDDDILKFYPYSIAPQILLTGGRTEPDPGGDYLSLFASLYQYSRGSVRIRRMCTPSDGYTMSWLHTEGAVPQTVVSGNNPPYSDANLGFVSPYTIPNRQGGFSLQVPSYNKTYARLNRYYASAGSGGPIRDDNPQFSVALQTVAPIPASITYSRAAADDFQMMYFLCIPELSVAPWTG